MNKHIETPLINQELIDYLEKVFPIDLGDVKTTIDELRIRQGERRVVDHLKLKFADQFRRSIL